MPYEINIPALNGLLHLNDEGTQEVQEVAGEAVHNQLKNYLDMLDQERPNKLGGDRTHFYHNLAGNTRLDIDADGATITIPAPFGYLYYGGTIHMKDKLLTVPARAEAHGHRAGDFDDLRFGIFASGTKFLAQKGTGLVYFWLVEEVSKSADESLLPTESEIADKAIQAVKSWWLAKRDGLG